MGDLRKAGATSVYQEELTDMRVTSKLGLSGGQPQGELKMPYTPFPPT